MYPVAEMDEQSFEKAEDASEALARQDRNDYTVPSPEIGLNDEGILRAGGFEGPMSPSGLSGLCRSFQIPYEYVRDTCPADLVATNVKRLAEHQEQTLRIQSINGVATGVMPHTRRVIQHERLIDFLGDRPVREITIAAERLLIVSLEDEFKELLPDDVYACGWQIANNEDGWHSTEADRLVYRQICSNGLIGFDRKAAFRRRYDSQAHIEASLEELINMIDTMSKGPDLAPATKWAFDAKLGRDKDAVLNYVSKNLEGKATKLALENISGDTSWYDLMNEITSLARIHQLTMRRNYEQMGGVLLSWFMSQGRERPPWRTVPCESCDIWMDN